jgi:hypothetical protein
VARDVVERRELGKSSVRIGESSTTSSESLTTSSESSVRARRELGDESPVWTETWSSGESSVTSLTRSDESSVKILQYKYVER